MTRKEHSGSLAPRLLPVGLMGLLLGFFLSACDLVTQDPQPIALLYGVSRYSTYHSADPRNDPISIRIQNPNLISPSLDVQDLSKSFGDSGYDVRAHTDADATVETLEAELATLESTIQDGQRIVFYFSGHGFQNTGSESYKGSWIALRGFLNVTSPNPKSASPYSANDATMNANFDTNEMLNDTRLANLFGPLIAKGAKLIVIVDACNSGGFVPYGDYTDPLPDNFTRTLNYGFPVLDQVIADYVRKRGGSGPLASDSVWVMSACGSDEVSYEEYDEYKHGVFSYFLIEAATLAASSADGVVSLNQAYQHIYDGLRTRWNEKYGKLTDDDYAYLPHLSGTYLDVKLFTR